MFGLFINNGCSLFHTKLRTNIYFGGVNTNIKKKKGYDEFSAGSHLSDDPAF